MKRTKELSYKDMPILQVNLDDEGTSNFRFGLTKARGIVKAIEEIKEFVERHNDEE